MGLERLNATRTSVATDGLTAAILNFRKSKMQTSPIIHLIKPKELYQFLGFVPFGTISAPSVHEAMLYIVKCLWA